MAQKILLRKGTSSSWSSVDPVLANGEPGIETDTGRFKVGDGSSQWSARSYVDVQGAVQSSPYRSFGDGSDGDLVLNSGTVTLSKDAYHDNLTISGTGKIFLNGFKLFVKGTLDLSNAPSGAIDASGSNGGNANGSLGGLASSVYATGSTLGQSTGTAGANGLTGIGTVSVAVTGIQSNGGRSNASGAGGAGGNGGIGSQPGADVANVIDFKNFYTNIFYGASLVGGGNGGRGGSSGGGDGVNAGGGGGAGGNGGGVVAVYANKIVTSPMTASCVIMANGGMGGNGGTPTTGNCGGGGGGSGGGGGWIYFVYNEKIGPVVKSFFDASGGAGGSGGNGAGVQPTGLVSQGGGAGQGGTGGRINIFNVPKSAGITFYPPSIIAHIPDTLKSAAAQVDGVGKNGSSGGPSTFDF